MVHLYFKNDRLNLDATMVTLGYLRRLVAGLVRRWICTYPPHSN